MGDDACSLGVGGYMGGRARGMMPAPWEVEDIRVEGRGDAAWS